MWDGWAKREETASWNAIENADPWMVKWPGFLVFMWMASLCCSFLLTLFPCSSVGSLPQDTVFRELFQSGFSFQWGGPSGTGCSSTGSPMASSSCQKTCSRMGSPWAQLPSELCSGAGSCTGYSMDTCPDTLHNRLHGDSLLHHGLKRFNCLATVVRY